MIQDSLSHRLSRMERELRKPSTPNREDIRHGGQKGCMIRCSSLFSQVLSMVDRDGFYRLVLGHDARKHSRRCRCRSRLAAALFCQLAQPQSIREMCGELARAAGKLKHPGLVGISLSCANARRTWEMYPFRARKGARKAIAAAGLAASSAPPAHVQYSIPALSLIPES